MSDGKIYVDGELYLSVETVAEVYCVEVVWLREVIDAGLLGADAAPHAPGAEPAPVIAAIRMDHVATIVRMRRVLGLDLEAIRVALEHAAAR